jgi:gamma-glutamylcyclotransferase (GGCT)/AIG2-like uncharacterized protein YtfP
MHRIFVYGSLKPGEPRYKILEKFAKIRNINLHPRPATTAGLLYAFEPTYPGMVVVPKESKALVSGYVLNIDTDPALVGLLNAIEGFDFNKESNFFEPIRVYTNVEEIYYSKIAKNSTEVSCWTYAVPKAAFNFIEKEYKKYPPLGPQKVKVLPPVLIPEGTWSIYESYFDKDELAAYRAYVDEEQKAAKSAEKGQNNA